MALRKIEAWLERRGYSLDVKRAHKEDAVHFDERVVRLRGAASAGVRTAIALHECGHVLVRLQRQQRPRAVVAGRTLKQFEQARQTDRTKCETLRTFEEELEAWNRGERLAARLKIGLRGARRVQFQRVKVRCLSTYAVRLVLPSAPKPTRSVK